jgi:hypothetical protein
MIGIVASALIIAALQDTTGQSIEQASALQVVNKTKFELAFNGRRVSRCHVTASSGFAQVDRYVCDAARTCGDKYTRTDRRAACLADKRQQLAGLIARELKKAE